MYNIVGAVYNIVGAVYNIVGVVFNIVGVVFNIVGVVYIPPNRPFWVPKDRHPAPIIYSIIVSGLISSNSLCAGLRME